VTLQFLRSFLCNWYRCSKQSSTSINWAESMESRPSNSVESSYKSWEFKQWNAVTVRWLCP